jgi:hypothetical protein
LTRYQGKDVGIEVDYWSSTGNSSLTSGSAGYKTGFFGFKAIPERWIFYSDAINTNDVMIDGTLGDMEVGGIYSNRVYSTLLDNCRYSFERFNLTEGSLDSPSTNASISMFSATVAGTTSYGTMPYVNVKDGQYRILVASNFDVGSSYELSFGSGKLITITPSGTPVTTIKFKYSGQGVHMIFDKTQDAWILLSSGAFLC